MVMKGLGELKPVYDFLNDRAGEYYSLEEIAEGVHSDPDTVKKHIVELRELHAIRSKGNKYYCPAK